MSSRPPRLKPGGAQRSYATGTQGRIAPGSNEKLVTCTVHYSDHVITGPRGLLVLSYLFLKHVAANCVWLISYRNLNTQTTQA